VSKLKKVNVLTIAKFQAFLFVLLGVLAGIIYSFGGFILDALVSLDWLTTDETTGLGAGTLLAFGALVGMPIIFAAVGYVTGLVEADIYNRYAKWRGGIDLEFK